MKIDISKLNRLIDSNLSLLTVGEDKMPNYTWKKGCTTPLTKEQFLKQYNYNGGYIKKDGKEMEATTGFGIITGYNNIEVIDVDLKVLPTLKEQNDFWSEYIKYLKDNIADFDLKFVIYKTKNQGYHIIYRCSVITGNSKIAKLKGHKEAIIESRGTGGYVFIYENKISKLSYTEIQEISEEDRDILWTISSEYNSIEEEIIIQDDKKDNKEYDEAIIKPWDDYNNKTSMFDIVSDEFITVRTLSDKWIIKRHGSKAVHSGYIYKNSGCMYLFSTGTHYPNEQLITPFAAYTHRYHNGNYKEASREIYNKGFGTRIVNKQIELVKNIVINQDDLQFPIDIFPKQIQSYLSECNDTLDSSIDFMGCSMLWLTSVIIGNSIQVEVKNGWREIATVWISIVGKAGLGKTPSISNVIFPLLQANNKEIKSYIKNTIKYDKFCELSEEDKKSREEIKKPHKTQFIANDITLEALVDLHQESKNAIGVFKDELNGWFKDMNKYRAGSDLEFWLSTWSGKSVSLNRKTAKSSFVDKPLIPVLGGIQPSILSTFYTDENKDNGFVDRMLLSFPDLEIEKYNTREIDEDLIQWYSDSIIGFYETIKNHVIKLDEEFDIEPLIAKFSNETKIEWERVYNEITTVQNSEEENEYMKSMLPKQKSYIPRFALLIHALNDFFDETKSGNVLDITKESFLKAEKLSKYFIAMAKKIKINNIENNELKKIVDLYKAKSKKEQFEEMYKINPDLNKKEAAEMLGISLQMIYKYIKEIKPV